jgi:hypothetical protein
MVNGKDEAWIASARDRGAATFANPPESWKQGFHFCFHFVFHFGFHFVFDCGFGF